ncbi:MAG: NAD(P)/FAD-dependent oxidoreductase [Erysipelotrichaceae bacterium]|jgi:predicted flavoprotein YhiN|nr:NAD(P)/FAD-dependent oxidoreductase [Erysipelotrichaceae bacterium]
MIVVIGGGPASFSFAIKHRKLHPNDEIIILEAGYKPLRKVLVAGGGKCNILNDQYEEPVLNNLDYQKNLFTLENIELLRDFYTRDLGLVLLNINGYYYPSSLKGETVAYALEKTARTLGIKVITEQHVIKIKKEAQGFSVITKYQTVYQADKIVLAVGSNLYYHEDFFNYPLFHDLELPSKPFVPFLSSLSVKEKLFSVKGIRARATVSLVINDQVVATKSGEIQFNDTNISGIVVMNLASILSWHETTIGELRIDFFDGLKVPSDYDLRALLPLDLAAYLEENQQDPRNMVLHIIGLNPKNAQVASGGILLEVLNKNYTVKKDPNIIVLGECLDVDGLCGGYNLMHAFLSGLIAGRDL